jgi:hypothetical protein
MILKGILIFALLFALTPGLGLSILSQGLAGKPPSFQNAVIKNKEEFKNIWGELGIRDEIPDVDFSEELVVVMVPKAKAGNFVEISRVRKKADDTVEIGFVVRPLDPKTQNSQLLPYTIAKLYPLDVKKIKVEFVQDILTPSVPVNNAIGQIPYYTNVLREYDKIAISQFIPLDKGNVWTYRIESKDKVKEETYSVLSVSQDGWSIFDSFFGKKNVAMRIDPSGTIFISFEKGMQTFYTPDIQRNFKKTEFSTPAGKFSDLMVVTASKDDKFWFKDVYARGVGLIYHEHKSPQGDARYILLKAEVRGKNYP